MISKGSATRFLIINPFGIGDVLFTTPVVRAIKSNYPDSFIGYWCNQRTQEILEDNHYIDRLFALNRGDLKKISAGSKIKGFYAFWNLACDLKKHRFDFSFDYSLDHRYSLLSKIIGIRNRLGFNYKKRGRFLTGKIDIDGYNNRPMAEYYADLIRLIGIEPSDLSMELSLNNNASICVKKRLLGLGVEENEDIIGIAPGAGESWGDNAFLKHWPEEKFAQLADKIIEDLKTKVIIIGNEKEVAISKRIVKSMRDRPLNLTGSTTLKELAALIKRLKILVTNDGGPLHMAVALGTSTVSIFGPVSDIVYGPYPQNPRHIVIRKELECRPCYNNFRLSGCKKDKVCLSSITTSEVFEAVRRLS